MVKHDPPKHLSARCRRLWRDLRASHHIEDAHALATLQLGLEALDRADDARRQIELEGAVVKDRFDQLKAHPACAIERDARSAVLAAFRALKLAPPRG